MESKFDLIAKSYKHVRDQTYRKKYNHVSHYSSILMKVPEEKIIMAIKAFKSNAKSSFGISAKDIKNLGPDIAPYLANIFSSIIRREIKFTTIKLESEIFFIYEGEGNKDKPENHRSIAIQNAILKTFMSLLRHRIVNFAESNNLLPISQFGFRKGRSTESAAAIVHHIVSENINQKKRVTLVTLTLRSALIK